MFPKCLFFFSVVCLFLYCAFSMDVFVFSYPFLGIPYTSETSSFVGFKCSRYLFSDWTLSSDFFMCLSVNKKDLHFHVIKYTFNGLFSPFLSSFSSFSFFLFSSFKGNLPTPHQRSEIHHFMFSSLCFIGLPTLI